MVEDSSPLRGPVSSEASPPASRDLVKASAALFCDMVIRARMNAPMNDGEVIVEAGRGVWEDFCAALGEEVTTAALANTPGWREIAEKAKKLKRVDLCGYYPSTKRGPRLKRIPDCYWHKKAGVWRSTSYDREGFRQLRANFVITHYREIDALPQPPEMKP